MYEVYILLTRTTTLVSRVVGLLTGDDFTHASLTLDPDLRTIYSFTRRHPSFPLPAGLVAEELSRGYWAKHRQISCALLVLEVDNVAYDALQKRLTRMLSCKKRYRYDLLGLLRCRMGFESRHPAKYFCSRFVAELLEESGAVSLPKSPSLMRPQDFLSLPGSLCLYRGRLIGLMAACH